MSQSSPGEGYPKPTDLDAPKREPRELKSVAEIAALVANKLTRDEMYYLVLAIEDSDFHAAVIEQWHNLKRSERTA
jgi:hypothetical protein